jgi:DnaJ-class molecular chaperone
VYLFLLAYLNFSDFFFNEYANFPTMKARFFNENNFEKFGSHLVYNAFLNLDDFQKGVFEVPHPEGKMNIKFPDNIDTSTPLRVKGKGFQQGDLLINQYLKYSKN